MKFEVVAHTKHKDFRATKKEDDTANKMVKFMRYLRTEVRKSCELNLVSQTIIYCTYRIPGCSCKGEIYPEILFPRQSCEVRSTEFRGIMMT